MTNGNLPGTLFFLLLLSLVAVSIFHYHFYGEGLRERKRQEANSAERAARAHARGWRYDGTHDGTVRYRIHGSGAAGLAWIIEFDCDHSSSAPQPKLHFRMPALAADRLEWQLVDAWRYRLWLCRASRAVFGGMLRLADAAIGPLWDHRRFIDEARDLGAGSDAFRQRFVLAGRVDATARLIDAETETLILNLPYFLPPPGRSEDRCLSAEQGCDGLRVTLDCDGPSFEVIEHLAQLGQALVARLAVGWQR